MKKSTSLTRLFTAALALVLLLSLGCVAQEAPPPTLVPPSPPPPPTPPQPPVEPSPTTVTIFMVSDPEGDLFDRNGAGAIGDANLDILESQLYLQNDQFVARIRLKSPPPEKLEGPGLLEWNVLIDSDNELTTGWDFPLIANDTGPDYYAYLSIRSTGLRAGIQDTKTREITRIEFKVDGNTVELRFPAVLIGRPASFRYLTAARKYRQAGDPGTLVAADKAPNEKYYSFPQVK